MADTHTQHTEEIDPEVLAALRQTGTDPALYLQRRKELRARTRTPEEEAALRAEQEELRPCLEASIEFNRTHGRWYDPFAEDDSQFKAG